ncbi:hypothetical protein CH92_13915 [Stutzerimonas stutzeri]|uniref:Glycosyltransferase 2-like domain-containing protein n=2 Tax=Stutzerimonas stutzeri TaxID=316 RepID=W8RZS9_STUST|nr:hypothetical protein CH92_13915 [Stutzerimonas stutzeri]
MQPNWQQLADNVNYNKAAGGLREGDRIDWLVERSEYFKECSLSSVLRQERRPDFWFLLFSSGDEWAAAHVLPEDEHWIKPIFLAPGQSYESAISEAIIGAVYSKDDDAIIVSRMDNDDALSPSYFSKLEETIESADFQTEPGAILFPVGVRWDGLQGEVIQYRYGPFLNFVYSRKTILMGTFITPLDVNHAAVRGLEHVFVSHDSPLWLQVIHGGNVSNKMHVIKAREILTSEAVTEIFGVGEIRSFKVSQLGAALSTVQERLDKEQRSVTELQERIGFCESQLDDGARRLSEAREQLELQTKLTELNEQRYCSSLDHSARRLSEARERLRLQCQLTKLSEQCYRSSLSQQLAIAVAKLLRRPLGILKIPLAVYRILRRHHQGRVKRVALLAMRQNTRKKLKKAMQPIVEQRKGLKESSSLHSATPIPITNPSRAWGAVEDICKLSERKASLALYKTVLRTGSLQGRELIAHIASKGNCDMQRIYRAIEAYRDPSLKDKGEEVLRLLSLPSARQLASVMAGQCYEQDDEINALTLLSAMRDMYGEKKLGIASLELLGALAVNTNQPELLTSVLPDLDRNRLAGRFLHIDSLHPVFGSNEEIWLGEINQLFQSYALEPIFFSKPGSLAFSNLTCKATSLVAAGPLVSVIVTAWEPDEGLLLAVKSLLQQSWVNLEVIIVDDASSLSCAEIFNACMTMDSRVKVIRQPVNLGTYCARNVGLREARGVYVTFQDSDDWSHPRRIELQVRALEGDSRFVSCHSYCLRVSENLMLSKPERPVFYNNASSLMFEREPVVSRVGYMDAVRKGADTEYALRIALIFGDDSCCRIEKPLAFVRLGEGSLSRDEFKLGWQHPARLAYKNIYRFWHGLIRKGEASPYLDGSIEERQFPAPLRFQVDRNKSREFIYDVVFIGDWRSFGGPQKSMIEEIKALHQRGLKIGICALEAYRFMVPSIRDLCEPVTDLIYRRVVDQVVIDDAITVRLAILRYPPILQWIPHQPFTWSIGEMWITANQAPHELDGRDIRYHVSDCIRNAQQLFGRNPLWVPQGPQVRKALLPLLPAKLLAPFDNPGIIKTEEWVVKREDQCGRIPVVGRYSRDNPMKFPSTLHEASLAYMAGKEIDVKIMGGTKSLAALLSGAPVPKNWDILPYGSMPVAEFLSNIDFFVYFDNELIVEAFGRSILEAITAGVVVILPPHFREVFGDAAIYCKAEEVFDHVLRYFSDCEMYKKQVEMASRYVLESFSYDAFYGRVADALLVADTRRGGK